MPRFSLVPYSIRVKERRTSKYLFLDSIPGVSAVSNVDLLELLHHYLSVVVPSIPINPDNDEVLRVDLLHQKARGINGRLKGGERGYGSDLVDTQTGNTDYHRTIFQAEIIPYYFLAAIPKKADKGIIVLQKFKNFGIKDLFFSSFYEYFKSIFGNTYTLEMDPLVPTKLVEEYLRCRILKVRFIKQGFPRDTFDAESNGLASDIEFEYKGKSEFVVEADRNSFLPPFIIERMKKGIGEFLSSSNEPIGKIIELKNFEYDNIKVQVQIGNSYRTIDFSNLHRIRYSEDVSGLSRDGDGHPKFDIIDEKAKEFLQDLALSIFGDKVDV